MNPLPDIKQVSGFRKFRDEYIIFALAAALIVVCTMYVNLVTSYRTEAMQRELRAIKAMEESTETTKDFLQYQRFQRPIRDVYSDTMRYR